ncbi:MAG: hypothetical protein ABSF29_10335, partial [Tepidisphaeraceae bacterium]
FNRAKTRSCAHTLNFFSIFLNPNTNNDFQPPPKNLHQKRAQKPSGARPYIGRHTFFNRKFRSHFKERILRVLSRRAGSKKIRFTAKERRTRRNIFSKKLDAEPRTMPGETLRRPAIRDLSPASFIALVLAVLEAAGAHKRVSAVLCTDRAHPCVCRPFFPVPHMNKPPNKLDSG